MYVIVNDNISDSVVGYIPKKYCLPSLRNFFMNISNRSRIDIYCKEDGTFKVTCSSDNLIDQNYTIKNLKCIKLDHLVKSNETN